MSIFSLSDFIALDLPPLLAVSAAALACSILGNFLVLRRMSLMGDAISHAVLPGIVLAFLITTSRDTASVFIGAAIAAVTSVICIQAVRRYGRVDSDAAMGIVFSLYFALGILLIEQAAARSVDLDADCLLHGQLQTIFWFPPDNLSVLFTWETLRLLPLEVYVSLGIAVLVILFTVLFYKELTLASFDSDLSTSLGFNASLIHYLLMTMVALAVVASFKIVGSILVVAMIVCPAAAARLFTDTLRIQLYLSSLISFCATVVGYLFAGYGPAVFGFEHAISAAGMIATVLGIICGIAALFAPRYGYVARVFRQRRIAKTVCEEDVLACLFREEEVSAPDGKKHVTRDYVLQILGWDPEHRSKVASAIERLISGGEIIASSQGLQLSSRGRERGRSIVRSHRLWESYLVDQGDLQIDHVHVSAEALEHFTDAQTQADLAEAVGQVDPHGKEIP